MYVTMGQSIRNNGNRHYGNACQYAADGNKEFAFGSFKKAQRNWRHADEIDRFVRGDWGLPSPDAPIAALLELRIKAATAVLQRNIEAALYG